MSVYLALLRRPGARLLALACTLGWLGFAGTALTIVLLVEDETGSFARAGLAVGLFSAGAGLFAPLRGRLIDDHGAPVLVGFAAAQCVLLLALAWTAYPALAGLAGAVAPPLIATARTVWPRIAGPELTRAGHGLNALLGDVGYVAGPAAAGGLVALAGPQVALAAFAGGPLAGALLVARLGVPRQERVSTRGRLSAGLRTMLFVEVCLGLSFGAVDVAAPALADGAPGLSALPLSAMAVGSILGSIWAGQSDVAAERRFLAGTLVMAVVLAGCAFVTTPVAFAALLCVAGAAFGVFNVGVYELLDVVVPADRAVEALTWLTTAASLGMAAGAAAAGQLAHDSPRSALLLVAIAVAPGAILAAARRRTLTASSR